MPLADINISFVMSLGPKLQQFFQYALLHHNVVFVYKNVFQQRNLRLLVYNHLRGKIFKDFNYKRQQNREHCGYMAMS
jgi:hypothetical protein